jgi:hypothetical protein
MPLPRKSIVGKTKKSTTKKKSTPTSRAKKGERLLVTCAPIVTDYMMDDLAQTLHGSFFTDPDGRYQQVVCGLTEFLAKTIFRGKNVEAASVLV